MGDNEEQKPAETLLKRLWLYFTRTGDDGVAGDTKRQIEKILDEVEEQGIIDEDQGDMIHNILCKHRSLLASGVATFRPAAESNIGP